MTRLVLALVMVLACAPGTQAQETPEALADHVMRLPLTDPFLRRGLSAEAAVYLLSDMGALMPQGEASDEAVGALLAEVVDSLLPEARQALEDDLVTAFEYQAAFDPTLAGFRDFLDLVDTEEGSFAFNFIMASFLDARARDDAPVARALEARRRDLQDIKNGD